MRIVTDCAADLTPEEIEANDITVAPLFINFPDGEINSMDLSPDEFYTRLERMFPQIPTTSQPSAGIFKEIYQKIGEAGEEVISIHISSGLSGTLQSARTGASQLAGSMVHTFDSLTLSGGERFQVLGAVKGIKAGWNKEAILERLQQIQDKVEVVFTLETLTYLAKGGRIGRVQALAGSLLNLKPIIHVDKKDGKYSTAGKVRTLRRALDSIADYLFNIYGSEMPLWISVMHGQFSEHANELAELLRTRLKVSRLEILRISPVLGVHTGPGVVGVAAVPLHLLEGIV